jgi:predicted MPP superfamily phosphohydrolase
MVSLINGLKPDLVAVTGDILDWDLESLPDAVRGLAGIQSTMGVYSVLGNHDIYADRYSYSKGHRGGVLITKGVETLGIRMLRNESVYFGDGQDRLALMGLDWLSSNPNSPSFFAYQQGETRRQLSRMSAEIPPETPRILLAHHPDTFLDTGPYDIGLTLSGHTHGGGQVILGTLNGVPLGLAMLRFKYLSGLYQERGQSLYVNRGIGYLGVPIRINCPPEISRFRLVRPQNS